MFILTVFILFFGTWLVFCSFDSKQIPEIKKKKCCSQNFWMWDCGCRSLASCEDTEDRRHLSTVHLQSLQWFPLILISGIISIQMKPQRSSATLLFTYRLIMQIHTLFIEERRLFQGPESRQQQRDDFALFPKSRAFVSFSLYQHTTRLGATHSLLLFPYFLWMVLHKAGH